MEAVRRACLVNGVRTWENPFPVPTSNHAKELPASPREHKNFVWQRGRALCDAIAVQLGPGDDSLIKGASSVDLTAEKTLLAEVAVFLEV
jgi:hypothetical protein